MSSPMQFSSNTVLVTGGGSGIGLSLARRFLQAGSDVIICGRREEKLRAAQQSHPGLHVRACDVADPSQRIALAEWITREFPRLNVLVNNAGIQRYPRLQQREDWAQTDEEIAINFAAPVHLTMLLGPDRRVP